MTEVIKDMLIVKAAVEKGGVKTSPSTPQKRIMMEIPNDSSGKPIKVPKSLDNSIFELQSFYNRQVLKKYNISEEEFLASYTYYTKNPAEFEMITSQILELLKNEKENMLFK